MPRSQIRAELALTGSVAVFACFGVWTELHFATRPVPPAFGAYLLTLGAAGCLLQSRRRPPGRVRKVSPGTTLLSKHALAATVGCLLCCLAYHLVGYPGFAPALLLFLGCYTLATYRGLRYALVVAAASWLVPTLPPNALSWYDFPVSMPAVGLAAAAVAGEAARKRRIGHEEQVRQAASTAEAHLGRRLAEERLRIARELHDVLAHTISVVAVQSSVALDTMTDSPDQAREAMLIVRGAAKQAMPELRATLGLLRGSGAADARPQPGLAQLPELVAQVQDAGLDVELSVDQDLDEASALLQLTAYRIVQESLTNVIRHASARRATVALRHEQDALTIEVADDGRGAPAGGAPGFGLVGMRERAEALGGELHAAARPEGGYRVLARLPWEAP
ncbi:sensor histidine kinase [Actinospica sp.]|jgi:signal transduction histidine kinase|uniref:sensor histidine kinase n=1 Tax=Actinospica sp. TaxID=1872142 RepID=UPI002BCEC7E0|nr:sensor histidine kinase [Actinospica sp.]HWG25880.1 sensor histidine kinase [Actinospica sp.]